MITVGFENGVGTAFLNSVRCAAYVCYPVIRPIGFKVGGDSTVVSISDDVLEDMTTFISNVSCTHYYYVGNCSLIKAEAVCNGELLLSELLAGSGIRCETDSVVLHSTAPVTVSVIFRFASGSYLSNDNAGVLEDAGYEGFVATGSRHCVVDAFTFKVVDKTDTNEIFEIKISTVDESDELTVLKAAVGYVKSLAGSCKFNQV